MRSCTCPKNLCHGHAALDQFFDLHSARGRPSLLNKGNQDCTLSFAGISRRTVRPHTTPSTCIHTASALRERAQTCALHTKQRIERASGREKSCAPGQVVSNQVNEEIEHSRGSKLVQQIAPTRSAVWTLFVRVISRTQHFSHRVWPQGDMETSGKFSMQIWQDAS